MGEIQRGPVEIAKNTWWAGRYDRGNGLQCNPYLILDGGDGVLIDPGSPLDVDDVYEIVTGLCPVERIRYLVAQHQDPDLCAAIPEFERRGVRAEVATHWRTSVILRYYGFSLPFYLVNQQRYRLGFGDGHELRFIPAPYLHFPGAVMTYDPATKVLFSGDLFGAFSTEWELFAGPDYLEPMLTFHEHYMPGNDNLRPVMELLLTMDIEMIAPQHGSIIRENVREHILALRDLECGAFLSPVKRELASGGGYTGIVQSVLRRLGMVFGQEETRAIFDGSSIRLAEGRLLIEDFNCTGSELWEEVFDRIYGTRGASWIGVVEPLVQKLVKEYDVSLPKVLQSTLYNAEAEREKLSEENRRLKELNARLEASLKETEESLIRCGVTGLYNERFFTAYMKRELESLRLSGEMLSLAVLDIDGIVELESREGRDAVDGTLESAASVLLTRLLPVEKLFRLDDTQFALYLPELELAAAHERLEQLRATIRKSEAFVRPVTISAGVVALSELPEEITEPDRQFGQLLATARRRVQLARSDGGDRVRSESDLQDSRNEKPVILVVDNDTTSRDLLKQRLLREGYDVAEAGDGQQALLWIETHTPDLIIAELMVPKLDGLALRDAMLLSSRMKPIPMILLAYRKDDELVERAQNLEIEHFLQKPYSTVELTGMIRLLLRRLERVPEQAGQPQAGEGRT